MARKFISLPYILTANRYAELHGYDRTWAVH